MKAENRGKRVRGQVVIANGSIGCVSADNPECIVAYTHWYRHDDNLAQLDTELESLVRCYSNMAYTASMIIGYCYKDYER